MGEYNIHHYHLLCGHISYSHHKVTKSYYASKTYNFLGHDMRVRTVVGIGAGEDESPAASVRNVRLGDVYCVIVAGVGSDNTGPQLIGHDQPAESDRLHTTVAAHVRRRGERERVTERTQSPAHPMSGSATLNAARRMINYGARHFSFPLPPP